MYRYFFSTILIVSMIALTLYANEGTIPGLSDLNPAADSTVKGIRCDVRRTLFVIKSGRSERELPALTFHQYTIKKGDNFWAIMSKVSLDIDTLMTVNDLSSPKDIAPGKTLYIPNMRGIILQVSNADQVATLLREQGINPRYVLKVNNATNFNRQFLFIPCAKITNLQRSLFLGIGFTNPLTSGRQSCGFGTRKDPFNAKRLEFHSGIDISCPQQSKIHAARDGKVVYTGYMGNYGKLVIIEHEHGYESYYGHLQNYTVQPGQFVQRGALIAYSGNTGRTTGPHLHFEVRRKNRPINPGKLLHQ